jgi:SAM-dependent methyltransferase
MTLREKLYGQMCFFAGNYGWVRWKIKEEIAAKGTALQVLDVGGRKSPYTSGLPMQLTVSDIPQEAGVRADLMLGFTNNITEQLKHRSNVKGVVIDDMTNTKIAANSYDMVVSIEVIEHVPADDAFVANIAKVLKPGGAFIFTTPNGDFLPNDSNPDHVRHYTKQGLGDLLKKHFKHVELEWTINNDKWHKWSLPSWKINSPIKTLKAIIGGRYSYLHAKRDYKKQTLESMHLAGVCRK